MIEVYTQSFDGVWFGVACAQGQIVASSFGPSQKVTTANILVCLPFNIPFQVFNEPTSFAKKAINSIKNIYYGKDADIDFSLAFVSLPTYTQKVLKATMKIPVGYVTSYSQIAQAAGGGPRAVGNVMAKNPYAPIVPCHRVVKSDFTLGGYGMGLKTKWEILTKEKRGFLHSKEIMLDGCQFEVFPVEYVLKNLV